MILFSFFYRGNKGISLIEGKYKKGKALIDYKTSRSGSFMIFQSGLFCKLLQLSRKFIIPFSAHFCCGTQFVSKMDSRLEK